MLLCPSILKFIEIRGATAEKLHTPEIITTVSNLHLFYFTLPSSSQYSLDFTRASIERFAVCENGLSWMAMKTSHHSTFTVMVG